jgi:Arc/MetJ-type ribon-helix-helix transcriptional regulator
VAGGTSQEKQIVNSIDTVLSVTEDEKYPVGAGPSVRVSVSIPAGTADAIRDLTGKREFSSFIAEAVERTIRRRLLRRDLDRYQEERGPFTEEELAWAEAALLGEGDASAGEAA